MNYLFYICVNGTVEPIIFKNLSPNTKLPKNFTGIVNWSDGTKAWYKNEKKHRENGPAVEYVNGRKEWYKNGLLHRENGPAVNEIDGHKEWYLNGRKYKTANADGVCWVNNKGQYHREDGPAIIHYKNYKFICQQWFKNNKVNREDGPAVEWSNGTKMWYINDKRHRENGPAIEYANGDKEWWISNIRLTKEQHKLIMMFSKESREKLYENDNHGLKNLFYQETFEKKCFTKSNNKLLKLIENDT